MYICIAHITHLCIQLEQHLDCLIKAAEQDTNITYKYFMTIAALLYMYTYVHINWLI